MKDLEAVLWNSVYDSVYDAVSESIDSYLSNTIMFSKGYTTRLFIEEIICNLVDSNAERFVDIGLRTKKL